MGRTQARSQDPESFSAEDVLAGLDTEYVGQTLEVLARTESTNAEARRRAEAGAPEGTLVVADFQTAGRGRLDRRWEAPPASSLLLSLVFRPNLAPAHVQRLTMVCSLAVLEAVELETGLRARLKWPNDIVLDGAKLCGILAETGISGDKLQYVVVGIGLNVNLDPVELDGDLLMAATSLSHALSEQVLRLPLLRTLLRSVEDRYERLKSGIPLHDEYVAKLAMVGQPVTVTMPNATCTGVAEGVDADGALLVRQADGSLRRIMAGDVTLRA